MSAVEQVAPIRERVLSAPVTRRVKSAAKPPFLEYMHNFRALAMLFIVAVHTFGILRHEPIFLQRGTLLFMFISGFLFQYLSYNFKPKSYWHKKYTNILIPYLIISLPIIILRIVTNDHPNQITEVFPNFRSHYSVLQVAEYYVTGLQLVPFWFIPMVCFYYLLAPWFIRLDQDGRVYYTLPLFIILSLVVTRSHELHKYYLAFVHYLSVYLLGMFSGRYHKELLKITDRIWPVLAGLFVLFVAAGAIFTKEQIHYLEQFLYVQKLILCWAFVYLLWKFNRYIPKAFGLLSDMSFGIFFLHYYLLYFIDNGIKSGQLVIEYSFLTALLLVTINIFLCMSLLFLLRKALGRNSRYLVGY